MSNGLIQRRLRIQQRIEVSSGAELLLRAVLHNASTRTLIDAELDRRARGRVYAPRRLHWNPVPLLLAADHAA